MASWKIGSRAGACARCERGFEDGERHVSTLVFNAEAELWREDLCSTCWTPPHETAPEEVASEPGEPGTEAAAGDTGGSPDGEAGTQALFWWLTRHRAEKKKTLQLDLSALEQIFVSLEGREEEPVRELRYLLCLILMRKRRVKLERLERSPEGESFLVKRPRRDRRFRVFVYDFSPERLDELRSQLQALFDGADLEGGVNLAGGQAGAEEPGESEVPGGREEPDESEENGAPSSESLPTA